MCAARGIKTQKNSAEVVLTEDAVALIPGVPYPVYACQIYHALQEAQRRLVEACCYR